MVDKKTANDKITSLYEFSYILSISKDKVKKERLKCTNNGDQNSDAAYAPSWGLSTLAKEFSAAACIMQSSLKELSTLVADRV